MQGIASGLTTTHTDLTQMLPQLVGVLLFFAAFVAWRFGLMLVTVGCILGGGIVASSGMGIGQYIMTTFHS